MDQSNIRKELHQYIDTGDSKLLKMMYAVAKEYNEDDADFFLSNEDIALFEARRNKRLNGESKVYSWDDAKAIIIGKKIQ